MLFFQGTVAFPAIMTQTVLTVTILLMLFCGIMVLSSDLTSANIFRSFAKGNFLHEVTSTISLVNKDNSGPKLDPCRMPEVALVRTDFVASQYIHFSLSKKKREDVTVGIYHDAAFTRSAICTNLFESVLYVHILHSNMYCVKTGLLQSTLFWGIRIVPKHYWITPNHTLSKSSIIQRLNCNSIWVWSDFLSIRYCFTWWFLK